MARHVLVLLLLIVCALTSCLGLAFDPKTFSRTQILRENVLTIWWNADVDANELTIAVEAKYITGFVGIGISANGGMYGADIAVFYNKSGDYVVEDRFASGFFEPAVDASQDVLTLAKEITPTGLSYVYKRKLNSCDKQDFTIDDRGTNVIFAFSNSSTLQYHGPDNRGSVYINFIHVEINPTLPASTISIDVTMPDAEIPAVETTYKCMPFNFPVTTKHHIIAAEPIVVNPDHVHHMILFQCNMPSNSTDPFICSGMATACTAPILLWARGTGSTFLPLEVGLPIGTADTTQYTLLQIHYNNPSSLTGERDASGFRVHYTPELRPNDLGIMIQGVPAQILTLNQSASQVVSGVCPESCLTKALPAEGVNVITVGFHMHKFGRRMQMQLFRGDKELKPVGKLDWFHFNYQTGYRTEKITLLPTDRLVTTCEWDTSASPNSTVLGGESTSNEMCYSFLQYYPRQPTVVCLDASPQFPGFAVCADQNQLNAPPSSWKIGQGIMLFDPSKTYTPYEPVCDPSKLMLSSATTVSVAVFLIIVSFILVIV